MQKGWKWLKHWHMIWVLIWENSTSVIQWIPTSQGLDGYQKSLHPCAMDVGSLSIGSVKDIAFNGWSYHIIHPNNSLTPFCSLTHQVRSAEWSVNVLTHWCSQRQKQPDNSGKILQANAYLWKNWRGSIEQNTTNNSPSNILWICPWFLSYRQKYWRCRRHYP